MAMREGKPLIECFKNGFKTEALEDYIKDIRVSLEQRGIRTDAFTMRVPHPLMCLWTQGQRTRLRARAKDFQAIVVLGCHSAAHTARDAVTDTDCRVVQGKKTIGLGNATVKFRYPATLELDAHQLPNTFRNDRQPSRNEQT
jgi:azurin